MDMEIGFIRSTRLDSLFQVDLNNENLQTIVLTRCSHGRMPRGSHYKIRSKNRSNTASHVQGRIQNAVPSSKLRQRKPLSNDRRTDVSAQKYT